MTLDSVNNGSNNTALYAAGGAAAVGAVAGGATGYFTKSILKDGVPTDEFVKKAAENMHVMPKETEDSLKQLAEATKKCKNATEYRDVLSEIYRTGYSIMSLDEAKKAMSQNSMVFELMGLEGMDEAKLASATSIDELVEQFGKHFDDVFAGKSVKEIQAAYDKAGLKVAKLSVINILNQIYDFDAKKFKNFDTLFDGSAVDIEARKVAQGVKDAASSIKWKAAGIYGAAAAAIMGLGTLIGMSMLASDKQNSEDVDVQEVPQDNVGAEEAQA